MNLENQIPQNEVYRKSENWNVQDQIETERGHCNRTINTFGNTESFNLTSEWTLFNKLFMKTKNSKTEGILKIEK